MAELHIVHEWRTDMLAELHIQGQVLFNPATGEFRVGAFTLNAGERAAIPDMATIRSLAQAATILGRSVVAIEIIVDGSQPEV